MHLAAAMGVPWLPQTLLLLADQPRLSPDRPREIFARGRSVVDDLLARNPGVAVHQMTDPVQDRLMSGTVLYLRVKYIALPQAYRTFLRDHLEPGGCIITSECEMTWPVTRASARGVFQFGGTGAVSPGELHSGSDRIRRFLAEHGSPREAWTPPAPDDQAREAEWGFDARLLHDLRAQGRPLRRLRFAEPNSPSPVVADLYRWWYGRLGRAADRLQVECFTQVDPYLTIDRGLVPFWLRFHCGPTLRALEGYLDASPPFDDIYLTLNSSGVRDIGLPPVDRWRDVLRRARRDGRFVGVDPGQFPNDFSSHVRYSPELKRVTAPQPRPGPLPVDEAASFLAGQARHTGAVHLD
jgi:hypothetical protein